MKAKSLFSLAIIVMTLAGCSENEITEQNPDANKPIGFDTYTAAQARGAENGWNPKRVKLYHGSLLELI